MSADKEMDRSSSKMKVVFRVVERVNVVLHETDSYPACEAFCWNYDGPHELHIEKVWIPKEGTVQKVV